ncbi:uracil/xanthine transporter [uncultured Metabacillus sp.]|uniref:uracil/xanthine transporter n=1 Tax=uncultured Metabacillus sp. TaxID=2860135 RepID=UPI002626EFD5|nr:uracil/xanthine transporter [uncultured Metabacillus sp.]
MTKRIKLHHWIAGLQWLFFLFTNTVVIPITVGAAFHLPQEKMISLLQCSFFFTGAACMLQAMAGHKRSVMEGQSGLWWAVILSLCYAAPSQGMSLTELGGNLAVGIIISGVLTIIIGLSGLSAFFSKLFTNGVMAVFMFLLGCRLNTIFLQGMLGISFGAQTGSSQIDIPIFFLSSFVAVFVILLSIKATPVVSKYSLLIGIMAGWFLYALLFDTEGIDVSGKIDIGLFPLGTPRFDLGIILTVVIAGLINISNTFGALKGTEEIYKTKTTNNQYRHSFAISGLFTIIAGLAGMVPYAPYVSSIGFLNQTKILERIPFILGGGMFMLMGIIPAISHLMVKLPLSVGSAVLLVAYLRLLQSSLQYFARIDLTTANSYRLAVPLFVGIIVMTFPSSYFESIPTIVRPLLSNGLLLGILLSLLLENIHFNRFTPKKQRKVSKHMYMKESNESA